MIFKLPLYVEHIDNPSIENIVDSFVQWDPEEVFIIKPSLNEKLEMENSTHISFINGLSVTVDIPFPEFCEWYYKLLKVKEHLNVYKTSKKE